MRSPATKEMVYPLHVHLPLFMKRQVLVNFAPRVIWALSGTVTSSTSRALSWQVPAADAEVVPSGVPGVPGVVVVEASSMDVGGTSVGRDKPDLVGGRVEVTKTGAGVFTVSCETLIQEIRLIVRSRSNIQVFVMKEILLGKY